MKKGKLLCILISGMVLLLSGCKSRQPDNVINIGYFPNITHAQALIMKNQGTLEQALGDEYDVNWVSFNAGPAEVEAIFAGEIDLGYIGPVPAINAYVKSKGDIKIISGATKAGAVLVTRADSGIESVADLDGKNVSIPQLGNTQHASLLNLLTRHNLETKANGGTVNVIAASNSDVKNLMDNKSIDAALVPEPWGSILEREAGADILLDYNEVWREGNYDVAVVIASKSFLTEHEDIVRRFMEEHKASTLYINENMEDAKKLVNEEIKNVTKKSIEDEILDSAFGRLVISDEISKEALEDFARINFNESLISELPDDGLIEEQFLK